MKSENAAALLPDLRLDGRLVIVTGASEGIGRAFATAYSRAGAEVVLVSRRREKLTEVQRTLAGLGNPAHIVLADLSRVEDIRSLPERVEGLLGGRNLALVLVNNAGFGFTKPAMEITEDDWDRLVDLHVKGTFFCSQALGQMMIERGYGKIINLSSTWSASTETGKSVYGLSKAAVSYLTAALSTEWAPLGVRVNALAPTTTLSESTRQAMDGNPARAEALRRRITLGRFAEPADLVGAALFLASSASDFVTGHTLFVDGGWHARG
jgi:NAD(P)-dependent dehydrogenase (short-subunit alcohol dehydrogenase family)